MEGRVRDESSRKRGWTLGHETQHRTYQSQPKNREDDGTVARGTDESTGCPRDSSIAETTNQHIIDQQYVYT